MIRFTIPGTPQQQGSKRYVGNGISIEANKNLAPWRKEALACAREAKLALPHADDGVPIFNGPVEVTMVAYFPRPRSHFGTGRNAGVLKESAPFWHISKPDGDKTARAVGDVLTQSGLVRDDCIIAYWQISKVYGDPRIEVVIADAAPLPAASEPVGEPQEVLL